MAAYSKIQEHEFSRERWLYERETSREVGTSYFDAVSNTIAQVKVLQQQWKDLQSQNNFRLKINVY